MQPHGTGGWQGMWSIFTGPLKSRDPQALWSCCTWGQIVPSSASFSPDPGARCEACFGSLLTAVWLLSATILPIEPVVAWLLQELPLLLCMSKNLQASSNVVWNLSACWCVKLNFHLNYWSLIPLSGVSWKAVPALLVGICEPAEEEKQWIQPIDAYRMFWN